jgi:hypothetical protein
MTRSFAVRSPKETVGGIVYFGRMLDKIREHAKGQLPAEYQTNLGKGFDRSCVDFLGVDYSALTDQVKNGRTDDQILDWCFATGHKPSDYHIQVWNEYMRKRGWNDELSDTLLRRKNEIGIAERSDVRTMFDFIDADEGRFPHGEQ